jgi:hypothetical protein
MRLAKAGYFNGDPSQALSAPVDIVLDTLEYERFHAEFEDAMYEMNKKD